MRKIEIKINDKDYLLEMNRSSIKWLESHGFSIADFEKKPITYFDLIWSSLFITNHKDISEEETMNLLEQYEKENNVADVIKFAIEEYTAFMNALAVTNSKENKNLKIIEA